MKRALPGMQARAKVMVDCATLWIGRALGRIERACLRSAVRTGHRVTLYCYAPVDGVPEGIATEDARRILPEQEIIRHASGSVSLFSNRFRYRLQQLGFGTWIDCDAYFVRVLDAHSPYLFGRDQRGLIMTGVLRLPMDSPLLPPLLQIFEQRSVPEWLRLRHRLAAHARLLLTGSSGIHKMPWGSAGPNALTALAHEMGLAGLALDYRVLYPVHWSAAAWIRDPRIQLDQVVASETVSVHLYNELIKKFKEEPAPAGSFLERLHEEGR